MVPGQFRHSGLFREIERRKTDGKKRERKRKIRWSAEKLLYCLCAMGFCAIPAEHKKC